MRQNLAHEIDLVTRTRDGFRDHFFSAAVAIHFGAIDDGQPQIDSSFQCRDFSRAIGFFLAHVPGAKPKAGRVRPPGNCTLFGCVIPTSAFDGLC